MNISELLPEDSRADDDSWLESIGVSPKSGFIFGRSYEVGRYVGVFMRGTLLVGFSQPLDGGHLLFDSGQKDGDGRSLTNMVDCNDKNTIEHLLH